jgi:NAD(P)H dehydrogenase (quinone)
VLLGISHTVAVNVDWNNEAALTQAMSGCNTVFVLTGYSVDMLMHGRKQIDAAINAGAKHIVHLGVPTYGCWLDKVNYANW